MIINLGDLTAAIMVSDVDFTGKFSRGVEPQPNCMPNFTSIVAHFESVGRYRRLIDSARPATLQDKKIDANDEITLETLKSSGVMKCNGKEAKLPLKARRLPPEPAQLHRSVGGGLLGWLPLRLFLCDTSDPCDQHLCHRFLPTGMWLCH